MSEMNRREFFQISGLSAVVHKLSSGLSSTNNQSLEKQISDSMGSLWNHFSNLKDKPDKYNLGNGATYLVYEDRGDDSRRAIMIDLDQFKAIVNLSYKSDGTYQFSITESSPNLFSIRYKNDKDGYLIESVGMGNPKVTASGSNITEEHYKFAVEKLNALKAYLKIQ